MPHWVKLCSAADAPAEGTVTEFETEGVAVCLARIDGQLAALDNWCPHRRGPLGQGWIEGNAVVCPWHSWAFDLRTGVAEPPERARIEVMEVRLENGDVLIDLGQTAAAGEPEKGLPGLVEKNFTVEST